MKTITIIIKQIEYHILHKKIMKSSYYIIFLCSVTVQLCQTILIIITILINIRHYIITIKLILAIFKSICFIYNVTRQIKEKVNI